MRYMEIAARAALDNVLHTVLLELTYRCNLDCVFCYNDLGLQGRRLDDEDYFRLLEDLARMQVLHLTLSGGEPLASPSFWPVGKKGRELGFVVRIKSNGHAVTRTVAWRLRDEIDPFLVEVSLHGARAATHDRQTQVPGSFERLLTNLEAMRAAGLRVKLNCTLTCWNESEIEEMFALADARGLQLMFDPVVTPRDDGDKGPLELTASTAGVERLYRVLRERPRSRERPGGSEPEVGRQHDAGLPAAGGLKNCGTGSSTLAIDPFGNVYPCVQWRRRVGNVHERSIGAIWSGDSPELDEIRALNLAAGRRGAALGQPAGFCLGLAEELTGDPLRPYPRAGQDLRSSGAPASRGRLPVLHG